MSLFNTWTKRKALSVESYSTGSKCMGEMNRKLHRLEGNGVYTFPDGSEYNGFFKRGKFHGYGRIKLKGNVIIRACYNEGKLVKLEDLQFIDGVKMSGHFSQNGVLSTPNWLYCSPHDRRYATEMHTGMKRRPGHEDITNIIPSRKVPPNCYDNGQGFLRPSNYISDGDNTNAGPYRFVSCLEEATWIREHCRKGSSTKKGSDGHDRLGRRFIESMLSMLDPNQPGEDCGCDVDGTRGAQSSGVLTHERSIGAANASWLADNSDLQVTPSSSSCRSLSVPSLAGDFFRAK